MPEKPDGFVMKIIQEPPKLKDHLQKKRPGAKIIPEKLNGFVMKITQDPPKFNNHCFYNTKDREQK